MHRGTEIHKKHRKLEIRYSINTCRVGCVFSARAALTYYICGRGGLMQRRHTRMCRGLTIANELTYLLISNLIGYKHTSLRRVLKKYTQAR